MNGRRFANVPLAMTNAQLILPKYLFLVPNFVSCSQAPFSRSLFSRSQVPAWECHCTPALPRLDWRLEPPGMRSHAEHRNENNPEHGNEGEPVTGNERGEPETRRREKGEKRKKIESPRGDK